MKLPIKYIYHLYLFTLLAGTLFFIPAIFVNRFITAPALWMQAGISFGLLGYILLTERIFLPPINFIFLMTIWITYHLWRCWRNIELNMTIITLIAVFFLFYSIWIRLKDETALFIFFTFLALIVSLWGFGQFIGLFSSYNGSFSVTGPFDNPAGISASLVVLFPFSLYCCFYLEKKHCLFAIIVACLTVVVIILSKARTSILATFVIIIFFLIRQFKERNIKLSIVHYTAIFVICLSLFTGLFFMKKESANGRLLIWQCTGQIIFSKPLFGYGASGFTANYMNEQANYFTKHPDSKYVMLADNIRHPFNEFLKWTVNYGVVGLLLTLLLIMIPLCLSRKKHSQELFFIRLSLLSIGICAFFSYPLNYPFLQLMTIVVLAYTLAANPQKSITITNRCFSKVIILLVSLGILISTAYQTYIEREWYKIAHNALRGKTLQMLTQYNSLYASLNYKDLFLYNYAAELNVVGHYMESQQIALKCDSIWADYNLQMLMADNCLQLQKFNMAEIYLRKATNMCPIKFLPLYYLTEIYQETGCKEEALILAQKIMDKKIKIPSPIINRIKIKMQNLLKAQDKLNDSLQLINQNMKLETTNSWQDCLWNLRTPKALLPT